MKKLIKKVKIFSIIGAGFFLTACGFHFKTGELLPPELRTMQFKTADKYSDMSRTMRQALRMNAITLVDEEMKNVPVFYFGGISTSDQVAALFSTGKEAEKVLMLEATATLTLPNGKSYPIKTRVAESFFDSPREALAKNTEKDALWKKMEQRAAEQLIHRLFALKDKLQPATETQ